MSMNVNANEDLILCFIAVIWRRIWQASKIYAKHKRVGVNPDIFLKCLKYNLYANTGIVEEIKPLFLKLLQDGFLMPQDYRKNPFVEHGLNLLRELRESENKKDFINRYSLLRQLEVVKKKKRDVRISNTKLKEKKDILKPFSSGKKFCSIIDMWDIETGLLERDSYHDLVEYFITKIFS